VIDNQIVTRTGERISAISETERVSSTPASTLIFPGETPTIHQGRDNPVPAIQQANPTNVTWTAPAPLPQYIKRVLHRKNDRAAVRTLFEQLVSASKVVVNVASGPPRNVASQIGNILFATLNGGPKSIIPANVLDGKARLIHLIKIAHLMTQNSGFAESLNKEGRINDTDFEIAFTWAVKRLNAQPHKEKIRINFVRFVRQSRRSASPYQTVHAILDSTGSPFVPSTDPAVEQWTRERRAALRKEIKTDNGIANRNHNDISNEALRAELV